MLQPGTDTDVTMVPTITTTTTEAREDFTAATRGCYFCEEVCRDSWPYWNTENWYLQINLMFLPYTNNDPGADILLILKVAQWKEKLG